MKHDTVLFDLGNTLMYFDSEWGKVLPESNDALLRSLQAAGLQLESQDFLKQIDERLRAYYKERDTEFLEYSTGYILQGLLADLGFPSLPDQVIRQALREMYAVTQSHWQVEADTLSTLDTLRRQGCRLGLISNAGDDTDVQTLVDKFNIRAYFDVILTSAAEGIRKPNPRIFQRALRHWNAGPGQAVMVGDTLGADILGALNSGIYGIWISRRADKTANQAHLETIRPDATVTALSELPGLLSSL